MKELIVNIRVVVLCRYLPFLWGKLHFSLKQHHLTEVIPCCIYVINKRLLASPSHYSLPTARCGGRKNNFNPSIYEPLSRNQVHIIDYSNNTLLALLSPSMLFILEQLLLASSIKGSKVKWTNNKPTHCLHQPVTFYHAATNTYSIHNVSMKPTWD